MLNGTKAPVSCSGKGLEGVVLLMETNDYSAQQCHAYKPELANIGEASIESVSLLRFKMKF
jgi:hypothetical protein